MSCWASLVAQTVKNLTAMQVRSLGLEDPLEKGMATHSSILAWRIPWAEEPGGPQSMGSKESDMTKSHTCVLLVDLEWECLPGIFTLFNLISNFVLVILYSFLKKLLLSSCSAVSISGP